MDRPYLPGDVCPEIDRFEAKSDPVQAGALLPPVVLDGSLVRFVTTGKTTPGGIPMVSVLSTGPAARGES